MVILNNACISLYRHSKNWISRRKKSHREARWKYFKNTLNLLTNKKLGSLKWIEYRELKKGAEAFKEIHDGTCVTPKIILIP